MNDQTAQFFDELKKASRAAYKEDKARAEAFVPMLRTEGWAHYIALLNAKLQGLSDTLLKPSNGIEGVLNSEYVKGAMFALMLARDLPSATIESMRQQSASPDEEDHAQ
jgi:hypothetical protein